MLAALDDRKYPVFFDNVNTAVEDNWNAVGEYIVRPQENFDEVATYGRIYENDRDIGDIGDADRRAELTGLGEKSHSLNSLTGVKSKSRIRMNGFNAINRNNGFNGSNGNAKTRVSPLRVEKHADMADQYENRENRGGNDSQHGKQGLFRSRSDENDNEPFILYAAKETKETKETKGTSGTKGSGDVGLAQQQQQQRQRFGGTNGAHVISTSSLTSSLHRLRGQWRISAVVIRDLSKAPSDFTEHLENIGLKRRKRRGIAGLLRIRYVFRTTFWGGVVFSGVQFAKHSREVIRWADVAKNNMYDFLDRRIMTPFTEIVNDVVLNKRTSLTDKEALKDAKRSLSAMLNDFMSQHNPKLSAEDRRQVSAAMDMSPISEEYELELRKPIQNLISGRIARLVLIQLQFVKKELLVAMQAIDELFNANQVNLQVRASRLSISMRY
jgi:hypothetical protein